jgi:hypothetical protein
VTPKAVTSTKTNRSQLFTFTLKKLSRTETPALNHQHSARILFPLCIFFTDLTTLIANMANPTIAFSKKGHGPALFKARVAISCGRATTRFTHARHLALWGEEASREDNRRGTLYSRDVRQAQT